LADGYRESTESWADLLRDCKRRGMAAPVLAVGDGALGFWGALREVFPQTRIPSPSVLTHLPVRAPVAGHSPKWNSADGATLLCRAGDAP